jgi:hypothetical protein
MKQGDEVSELGRTGAGAALFPLPIQSTRRGWGWDFRMEAASRVFVLPALARRG